MGRRKPRGEVLSRDWDKVFRQSEKNESTQAGLLLCQKPPHKFRTRSVYDGSWNNLGMAGFGKFTMPHDVIYKGFLQDSEFNAEGTLEYPMGQEIHGTWDKGHLVSWNFKFRDGLQHCACLNKL